MSLLTITLKNNLQLDDVPPVLMNIITEKLTFFNPRWLENDRLGRWNRATPKVLRFYDKVGKSGLWIPRGYMRQLIVLCRSQGINYRIDDQRRLLPPVDFFFKGHLKPFQQVAASQMLRRDFGTLSSATGSGKTVMALYIIAQRRQPALIVVHTKELASQWMNRIESFLGIPFEEIGTIGGGNKVVGEKITVALVQSLYKCAEEIFTDIGFLVVDECHRCPSRTFTEAVTCFDSKYMLGLSATPWRRDRLSKLIFWHLGDIHHEVDKNHLVETGAVLTVEVIERRTNFIPRFDPITEYSKMLSELTTDTARNMLIATDIARESTDAHGICLVLSDRKAHCENLRALLQYRFNVESEVLTGDLNSDQRNEIIAGLDQNKVKVLIATGQLIGEGFDCKQLSTLFMATPISFSGRVLQYLGRVLRPAAGKSRARVFDYIDIHVEPLRKAARSRQRIYKR